MLIGAHVSPAGGLVRARQRGVERACEAIQIFSQNPRMWRPTEYRDDDVREFRELMAAGPLQAVAIHAVYLINPASKDAEVRRKSRASMVHALQTGDRIGAIGVVVHPGSAVGDPKAEAMKRIVEAADHALAESGRCRLLFEDTAGAGETIGRTFEELAELIDGIAAEHRERVGVCLDCCHLVASGYDVRSIDGLAEVVDEFDAIVGLDRLHCLHVNDSQTPLGSNRDRHANIGDGELGEEGIAAFLSEQRFEGLPALLEVPGTDRKGPDAEQVAKARQLRARGLAERA